MTPLFRQCICYITNILFYSSVSTSFACLHVFVSDSRGGRDAKSRIPLLNPPKHSIFKCNFVTLTQSNKNNRIIKRRIDMGYYEIGK